MTLSVVDAAVVQQLCLSHLIGLIEAAVLTVGSCQPEVTGLLLPFHSDAVIFSPRTFHREQFFLIFFIFSAQIFIFH
jgi:hypothetical protein